MSSQPFHLLNALPATSLSPPSLSIITTTPNLHPLVFSAAKPNQVSFHIPPRCSAVSDPRTHEYRDLFQETAVSKVIKRHAIVEDDIEEQFNKVSISTEISKHVESIKSMLESMEDGEISISAYDTAWVALVGDISGSASPQFPSSLQWIARNQLPDGSWGDSEIFTAHDRILNTLACVIALKSWNLYPDKCEKGMKYFKENLCKLEDENSEHMPIGFEVAFPSLLELARNLDIQVPEDSPVLKEIYASRNLKLTKIPKDIMHKVPTTLLHSLEGMQGLEWEKLLRFQCSDGSFLFSPSSTAFALMQTKDPNCFEYLNKIVQRFKGGVPNVYPVDLFEHIWAVDRLQRLGISRYFEKQLKECVNYVARYWEDGICWARKSPVHDIDDTAMGFRLLRLYGHQVSSDVFKHFKKGDTFFCFAGQSTQAVTGMFNLYRASQVLFPGEKILEEAKQFSSNFLKQKQDANQVLDKWIITKDLPGEVKYALDVPWYASLPRVESRFYIEQYGGQNDVWIGKTLYRMPYVNNNDYLDLAKLDYNSCQALHRIEWDDFQKWHEDNGLGDYYGVSRNEVLLGYFVAAASIFEPERSTERLAWAKTTLLLHAIHSYFHHNSGFQQRRQFVHEFQNGIAFRGHFNGRKLKAKRRQGLVKIVLKTLNDISLEALVAHGKHVSHSLLHAWENWLLKWEEEGDRYEGAGELLVKTINLAAGHSVCDHSKYEKLFQLTNKVCYQLAHYRNHKVQDNRGNTTPEIESNMQQIVQLMIQNSSGEIDTKMKQTFFIVAKSFYYQAICDPGTINYHIVKVLFERVFY